MPLRIPQAVSLDLFMSCVPLSPAITQARSLVLKMDLILVQFAGRELSSTASIRCAASMSALCEDGRHRQETENGIHGVTQPRRCIPVFPNISISKA